MIQITFSPDVETTPEIEAWRVEAEEQLQHYWGEMLYDLLVLGHTSIDL